MNLKSDKMASETAKEHQNKSSDDITCGIITLSDSRKSEKLDLSGKYISEEIESRYTLKSKSLIPDEKQDLIREIDKMILENIDVILTTGGTGLDTRDITVETVESLFEKKLKDLESFLELNLMKKLVQQPFFQELPQAFIKKQSFSPCQVLQMLLKLH